MVVVLVLTLTLVLKQKNDKGDKPPPPPPRPPRGGGGRSSGAGNVRHMDANGRLVPVDPIMSVQPINNFIKESTEVFDEIAVDTERAHIGKMSGIANAMTFLLLNRSHVPSAMPDDDPVPSSDGAFHRTIGDTPGPQDQGYGPVRRQILNATNFDGVMFKHIVGSAASASSSAAAAAGGYIVQHGPGMAARGLDNLKANVSDTVRIAASGTGAVLNFASQHLLPPALTEEEYHQRQAHEIKLARDREIMSTMARLHENAFLVQEQRRLSEEAERKRTAHSAAVLTLAK